MHDSWAPYESIAVDDRQYCLVHLLRELEKVDQHNSSDEWRSFAKLLRRHWDHLFTFLDKPEVPFENYLAERAVSPTVILRQAGQSSRSERGAAPQSVLMTLLRTLKLRGLDPIATVTDALQTYAQTGALPALPQASVARG